jgi:hypothetical protein
MTTSTLRAFADALRQYADDVLRGDFSVFPQLAEAYEEQQRFRQAPDLPTD